MKNNFNVINLTDFEIKVIKMYLNTNPCRSDCKMKVLVGHERRLNCFDADKKGHICPMLEASTSIYKKLADAEFENEEKNKNSRKIHII